MSLEEYNRKRTFNSTPEPPSHPYQNQDDQLIFVIHKHNASHLHYDLRIELDGVLKSWAIPRGPSSNPSDKRLAILVEDHPFEYRNFEGIIPPGNYGAGTVMIWDEGTFRVPGTSDKVSMQSKLRDDLSKGNIHIEFNGHKIKGLYQLIETRFTIQKSSWLIIKKNDEYAADESNLNQDYSVRTGRTLDEISNNSPPLSINVPDFLLNIPTGTFPLNFIKPMTAILASNPFDRPGWIFEVKWDGYRAIAEIRNNEIRFYSRNGKNFLPYYPPIANDLKKISHEVILDGEIVVIDSQGRADFGMLQNYHRNSGVFLVYFVFDLLFIDSHDLSNIPLHKRKSILKTVLPPLLHVKYCEHIENDGIAFFDAAKKNHLEGIMAKDKDSFYYAGKRSSSWQKIKIIMQQEVVVGGFTMPKGGRSGFGSLLAGVYDKKKLVYVGNVGGGFTDEELPEVRKKLDLIKDRTNPFTNTLNMNETDITFVRPELVIEVHFAEWTSDGIMRQPVFKGIRIDIAPEDVHREIPESQGSNDLKLVSSSNSDKVFSIGKINIKITNTNKLFWPEQNITKGDLIEYYRDISSVLLPYLIDRPQSLHRFPDGITGKHFFHKDIDEAPPWVQIAQIKSDEEDRTIRYLLCQNEETLVYMANLGAIEINPWTSRIGHLNNPDFLILDLDPLNCPFSYVIKTAVSMHELLEQIETPHYLKTSGATGLHINIPLETLYTYEQSRQFALLICIIINRRIPEVTSLERLPQNRTGKVYLDFLQNIKGKTMASPYSLRPLPYAPVSTPLLWEELHSNLLPSSFTITTIRKRLDHYGDLWKPVIGKGIDMQKSLKMLKRIYENQ